MLHLTKRILLFILVICLLSGCWGRTEVNNIAIVSATGLDLTENDLIRVTLLLAVPRLVGTSSGNGGGESKLETTAGWVVSEQGKTVTEAYNKLQGKLPRKIFFSHNRVIVIGEKLAEKGTFPIFDFFIRNRQAQLKSFILFTKAEAEDVLNFKPKFEKLASEVMKGELKVSMGSSVQLGNFITMIMDVGQEAYAPQITIVPSKNGENGLDNLMVSKGAAIFQEDKLIGWLNDTETVGLLWIRNEMKEGTLTVDIPGNLGGGYVSGELANVRSQVLPAAHQGSIKMDIDFSALLNVTENTSKLDLNTPANRTMLSNLFANEVKERMEMLCMKVQQKFHSDIFGFGQIIYKQDPQVWHKDYARKWETLFADMKVDISAKVQLVQTGLLRNGSMEEEMK